MKKKLKIAIVPQMHNPLPTAPEIIWAPGTIITHLANGLQQAGHSITLFAATDSKVKSLISNKSIPSIIKLYPEVRNNDLILFEKLKDLFEHWTISLAIEEANKGKFDIIHFHDFRKSIFFSKLTKTPCLFTYHDQFKSLFNEAIYNWIGKRFFQTAYFTALSKSHKKGADGKLNIIKIVHNGINTNQFKFNHSGGNNMLFLGRLIEAKGVDTAIQVSKSIKRKLIIAGHYGLTINDRQFFNKKVLPICKKDTNIKLLGSISHQETVKLYRQSKMMLAPIRWNEPFGMTIIESMSCGTPVVAFDRGAVRELIIDGKTGFVIEPDNIKKFINAVNKIYNMPQEEYETMRLNCRKHIENHFTIDKMIDGYEAVYEKIIKLNKK